MIILVKNEKLAKGVGEFRKALLSLKQDYEFSKFQDFKICAILITLISIFKYCAQKFLIIFCSKILKKKFREPKNEDERKFSEQIKKKYQCIVINVLCIYFYQFLDIIF